MKTSFLGMVELSNGKAETIVDALDKFQAEIGLSTDNLIGLGSDGASVMVGRKSGVCINMYKYN